jgi:hypothetical protein
LLGIDHIFAANQALPRLFTESLRDGDEDVSGRYFTK